jgi:prophage maintenance system killer protein
VFESESFSPEEIETIIDYNRLMVSERGEDFEVDRDILYSIFERLDIYNTISNDNTRIIRKSAHLLGGIAYEQPFFEGNKEIALRITRLFLRRNRHDILLDTRQKKLDMYDLLVKTVAKFPEQDIISDVETFLLQVVVDLPT